ncbi:hypothetical protein EWM64_g7131 [Hericium alpestre]|uniref:Uncharacterized protein n=1 Tax=Hericium alpestre TaxID=135208 RepID=A0A4Y9ZQ27_9AGAM|nr:hypothetical protein EWM64_g7131 [Hericium alpestre]
MVYSELAMADIRPHCGAGECGEYVGGGIARRFGASATPTLTVTSSPGRVAKLSVGVDDVADSLLDVHTPPLAFATTTAPSRGAFSLVNNYASRVDRSRHPFGVVPGAFLGSTTGSSPNESSATSGCPRPHCALQHSPDPPKNPQV